jgi:NTE family protein
MKAAVVLLATCACASTPSSPAASDPASIARLEIERFEGRGDASVAPQVFADGYVLHFPGAPPLDAQGHAAVMGSFRASFPDLRVRVLEQIVEGDRVANHVEVTGTHTGAAFNGVPATGKPIRITGSNVMRFAGGRIAETWGYLDAVTMMQQLGAMPAPPPASYAPLADGPSGTTPAQAKALAHAFFDGFNAHDPQAASLPVGDEYRLDFPGGPRGAGREGLRAATAEFIAAFPDLKFTVEDALSDGARVVVRWTMTGTHKGPLGPAPASGKPVSFGGISIVRVKDGAIVEDRVRADMVALYTQVGLLPPPR